MATNNHYSMRGQYVKACAILRAINNLHEAAGRAARAGWYDVADDQRAMARNAESRLIATMPAAIYRAAVESVSASAGS